MPITEYRSPGVYGGEKTPARAAEGLSPAKMGIVGWTDKGPSNFPIQVSSIEEFTRAFGGISMRGFVPIEMRGFFGTGGERAWVSRVVPADAVSASVGIDASPGPTKWTFTANGEGIWGNDLKIRIRGNRNFLNRTTNEWEKFDVLVLEPSDFDPSIDSADEVYEQVQFDNPAAFDYVTNVINDPRKPSMLIRLAPGAGGTPSGLLSTSYSAEAIGTGGGAPLASRFVGTLAHVPVLDSTLVITAISKTVRDETETVSPAIDGVETSFTYSTPLANLPVVEGSLSVYYQRLLHTNVMISANSGLIDGANKTFVFDAGNIANPIHRETAAFSLKYAATAGASPQTLSTTGGSPATYDLSGTSLTTTPVHPGTVSIAVNVNGVGLSTITDDAAGVLTGSNGSLPLGGTINYVTGAMTGVTASLAATSTVVATYNKSNLITKTYQVHLPFTTLVGAIAVGDTVTIGAASGVVEAITLTTGSTGSLDVNVSAGVFAPGALTDTTSAATATVISPVTKNNLYVNVSLLGSVDGSGINTVSAVDSLTDPAAGGLLSVKTLVAPIAGTNIYLDYVALGIVRSTVAGTLFGDIVGSSTFDFDTGAAILTFSNAPLSGSTVEASYEVGQLVQDDGLGNLIGDIAAAGNNIIDYDLGTFDVTFVVPPPTGTPIVANYVKLAQAIQFQLSGGSNGSAVSRNDISNPTLQPFKKGIYALDQVEEPLNVVVPDFEGSAFVQEDIIDFAVARQNRFAILGFANGTTEDEAVQYVLVTAAFDTKIAAIYYPNIYYVNDLTGFPELVPCTGFIAGVYAKTARNKNVGKSPGGIADGALDDPATIGPEVVLPLPSRDNLYSARINPLMTSAATGFVVWGVRTLSRDIRWRYINARLLHNFLMYQIGLNLTWAVFENNGPALWVKITTALEGFMGSLFRLGYFAGQSKDEAYFVKCDSRNNNQATIDAGRVNIDVGFSPNKPAEFVVFTLQQPVSQSASI